MILQSLSVIEEPTLISEKDWLAQTKGKKAEIWSDLEETYGKENAATWFYRWQIFYMACAELFAFSDGDTWGVSHYLFQKSAES